jgi:hypothetical protein
MIVLIVSLLTGLALGQRFKVLVLVPAAVLAITLTIAAGLVQGEAFWPTTLIALAATVSMQIGYLLGLGIRSLMLGVGANSLWGSRGERRAAH